MKDGNRKSIFIVFAVLILILFVNAGTRTNGVKPIDDYNIDNNTLRIGRENIPINTYNNIGITEKQSEMIKNVIKNDFLVNNDTVGGGTDQYDPSVSMDNAGNFVVVWYDYRNGDADIGIQGTVLEKVEFLDFYTNSFMIVKEILSDFI